MPVIHHPYRLSLVSSNSTSKPLRRSEKLQKLPWLYLLKNWTHGTLTKLANPAVILPWSSTTESKACGRRNSPSSSPETGNPWAHTVSQPRFLDWDLDQRCSLRWDRDFKWIKKSLILKVLFNCRDYFISVTKKYQCPSLTGCSRRCIGQVQPRPSWKHQSTHDFRHDEQDLRRHQAIWYWTRHLEVLGFGHHWQPTQTRRDGLGRFHQIRSVWGGYKRFRIV